MPSPQLLLCASLGGQLFLLQLQVASKTEMVLSGEQTPVPVLLPSSHPTPLHCLDVAGAMVGAGASLCPILSASYSNPNAALPLPVCRAPQVIAAAAAASVPPAVPAAVPTPLHYLDVPGALVGAGADLCGILPSPNPNPDAALPLSFRRAPI